MTRSLEAVRQDIPSPQVTGNMYHGWFGVQLPYRVQLTKSQLPQLHKSNLSSKVRSEDIALAAVTMKGYSLAIIDPKFLRSMTSCSLATRRKFVDLSEQIATVSMADDFKSSSGSRGTGCHDLMSTHSD